MSRPGMTALILAGQREGAQDALAAAYGVSHKCLVPLEGRPLLAYPLATLSRSPLVHRILVSVDAPDVLALDPELARLASDPRVQVVRAAPNLVDSVRAAAAEASFPLLITTADNVLLTVDGLARMAQGSSGADAAAAFARRTSVLAAHPDGQRKFYAFRDAEWSNCNMYWIGSPRALAATETFREGGQFVKYPKRMIAAFGLLNLIRFRLGLDSLAGMMRRFSRRLGIEIRAVEMPDGALAIDVDNERTHGVAGQLIRARRDARAAA